MKKLLLFTVALLCAVSMWADDPIIEGPWTLMDFKATSCAKNQNDSMCYNDANAKPWPSWYACTTDQYGTGFHYIGNSPNYTKMGFFAIFKSESAVPSYSSMTLTWKYKFYSQSKEHFSTVCLHALPDEYDSISSLKVPFTNRYDQLQPAVVPPMLGWFYNDSYSDNMKGSGQKTATFTFDNINGDTTQTKSWYLLMSYMIGADDQMIYTSLDERGTFKSDDIDTTWTYRKIVTFDANGGTGNMDDTLMFDDRAKLPRYTFTREGYMFQGWALSPDGEVVYVDQDFITATAEDKGPQTLYAVWTKWGEGATEGPWTQLEWNYAVRSTEDQDHNIKFTEMNGEQWPGTVSAIHDNIYGIGFRYEGSSPDNSLMGIFSTYMTSITVPSYARVELKWRYFPNSMSTKHHSATCLYGPADSYEELTNMDVDFTNHYTDKSGEDSLLTPPLLNEYQDGQTLMNICYYTFDSDNRDGSEELTQTRYMMMTYVIGSGAGKNGLYEHGAFDNDYVEPTWTYRKIVTFDANGSFGTMENQNIDDSGKLSPNAFTREGYMFQGWALTPDGSVVYADRAEITATAEDKGPQTLYAVWTKWEDGEQEGPWTQMEWKYSVGSTEDQDQNIKFTEMNGELWSGTVKGWNDEDGIGLRFEGVSGDNSKQGIFSTYMNTTSAPAYTRVNLTWTFQLGSKSNKYHSSTCLYGLMDSYDELKNLDVDFTNQFTDKTGEDYLLAPAFVNKHQDGAAYYSDDYTISIDCDNRDGSEQKDYTRYMMMTYVIGSGAGKSGLYEWGAFKSIHIDTTWTYRKVITFDANGGFGTMENQIIDDSGELSPNAFTRAGYVFTGWATEQNGPVVYVDKESITVTEESKGPMTLYAKWKSIQSVDIPDPFIGYHLWAEGIVLEIESPHDSIEINLYILDVEGHDHLVSGKTYTWEDMGHNDCYVEVKGIPVDRIPLVDANITRMYDDQGKYHIFGYAVDALGNRYSFHKDYYPETKGDTIEVAVSKSMNLEYDGQWHLSGDNRVYQMMLTFNSGMDSLVGHYTLDNIDTTLSYVYKMRNSMLSIRQADIDITETGDTLTISAYLAASDSNVYHFNGFYTAPKPLIKDTIIATNLYIDTDNLYGISGIFQAEASNQNYVVKLSLSTESDDIYGTHTIGLTTGNSGVIIDNSTAQAKYLPIYEATITVLPTEFGTVIIGSALCNGNIEYNFHLSYYVPAKTRDANLDMQHLSLEQGIGTWTLSGFSDDSTQFVSLDFNNYEIAGLYDIVHMSPNESYIMTDIKWQNGKAVSYNYYQLIDADLAAAWDDEEGVASVIGTIRAKDREDIPEFIVSLSNSPSKPQGIEETIFKSSNPQIFKFIKDGHLFILRDGKLYNAQGVLVESRK